MLGSNQLYKSFLLYKYHYIILYSTVQLQYSTVVSVCAVVGYFHGRVWVLTRDVNLTCRDGILVAYMITVTVVVVVSINIHIHRQ